MVVVGGHTAHRRGTTQGTRGERAERGGSIKPRPAGSAMWRSATAGEGRRRRERERMSRRWMGCAMVVDAGQGRSREGGRRERASLNTLARARNNQKKSHPDQRPTLDPPSESDATE